MEQHKLTLWRRKKYCVYRDIINMHMSFAEDDTPLNAGNNDDEERKCEETSSWEGGGRNMR